MSFLRNIVTGKDNKTYDVARVIMLANAVLLIPVLFLGIGFYFYGYLQGHAFDMQTLFTAVLTYEGGVGTLMTTGAASIFLKKTTEPDGTTEETEQITKGRQPDINILP